MSSDDVVKVEVLDERGGPARRGPKRRKVSWQLLVAGFVLLVMGVACLVWPGRALEAVGILAGLAFLFAGVMGIADFFATGGFMIFSGWILFDGIVSFLLGVLFLMTPVGTGVALAWLLAIFVLMAGFGVLASALRLRPLVGGGAHFWLWLLAGILTLALGCFMLFYPVAMSIYLGIFTVLYGALVLVAAFEIPRLFA